MPGSVLVVDDLARPRRALATELEDAGFSVVQAANGDEAWTRFCESEPDVVITDLVMPRQDGLDLLSRIRTRSDVPVILFTAHGTVQSAASAFKAGADDFISSPDVGVDDLVAMVARAAEGHHDASQSDGLATRLVGSSRAMTRLRERLSGLAPLRTPVLVCGEPGTGRDTVVEALHELGSTAGGALMRVDTRAFTPTTRIPLASAIYLDGIEQLSSDAQRYWTERITKAETKGFQEGPRVFASTTGPAPTSSDSGVFQELRGSLLRFAVELPPLRTIPEDVPAIADSLVARIGDQLSRKIRLSPSARDFVASQRWPGNARQLEHALERTIAFSRGRQIRRGVIKEVLSELEESVTSIREHHRALERDLLLRAIRDTGGNISQTAAALGKSRSAVYRLIEKYEIALSRER